jgi:hypothetical protein
MRAVRRNTPRERRRSENLRAFFPLAAREELIYWRRLGEVCGRRLI